MSHGPRNTGILFALVVTFCLVLIGWWAFFLVRESRYLDEATALVTSGKTDEALRRLGADDAGDFSAKAHRLRVMFTSEGIALVLLVLVGIVMLYRTLVREQRLREEQERFLIGATHHFKTPLATVRLGIESMLAGSMPEEKRDKYLKAMLRETDHLERDLTNLLAAGGLQALGEGIQLRPGDLAEDVRNAADSMRDRFDAAGVTLDTAVEDHVVVQLNREAIHLILHNLLDNAVKYSSVGGVVSLSLARDDDKARLSIRDTGRGIQPDEINRIFDRFFRGSGKGHKGGSGIGLYLVRELVHSHGGTVSVASDGPGTGADFTVEFPLQRPTERPAERNVS